MKDLQVYWKMIVHQAGSLTDRTPQPKARYGLSTDCDSKGDA